MTAPERLGLLIPWINGVSMPLWRVRDSITFFLSPAPIDDDWDDEEGRAFTYISPTALDSLWQVKAEAPALVFRPDDRSLTTWRRFQ